MKRSGKFYYRNERETLEALGLKQVPGSGNGWVAKEDGENDYILAQLKSTDSSSYRLNLLDWKKLEFHASVSHKIPVFLIQFLQQNKIYALVAVEDLPELAQVPNLLDKEEEGKRGRGSRDVGVRKSTLQSHSVVFVEEEKKAETRKIKSSASARNKFFEEREKQYGKRK